MRGDTHTHTHTHIHSLHITPCLCGHVCSWLCHCLPACCCRGWTAIVNDDLIWRALLCGAIVLTAIAAMLGLGCAWLLHAFGFVGDELINESLQMGCVLGLLVGGITASLLSTMLDSSVAMVFVSFAENPSALQVHDMTSQQLLSTPPFFLPSLHLSILPC